MNVAYDELDKMLTVSDIQKHLRMSRKKAYQLVSHQRAESQCGKYI